MAEKLANELKRNRELTRKLYTLRGEVPPNDTGCAQLSISLTHSHLSARRAPATLHSAHPRARVHSVA